MAAGATNIGSGILHGIGDSIVRAMNNAEIKGMEKKVFDNPAICAEFTNAVISACIDVGKVVLGKIENHCKLRLEILSNGITFDGESLEAISDAVQFMEIVNAAQLVPELAEAS